MTAVQEMIVAAVVDTANVTDFQLAYSHWLVSHAVVAANKPDMALVMVNDLEKLDSSAFHAAVAVVEVDKPGTAQATATAKPACSHCSAEHAAAAATDWHTSAIHSVTAAQRGYSHSPVFHAAAVVAGIASRCTG